MWHFLPFTFFLLPLPFPPLSRFEPGTLFLCAPPAPACVRITDNLLCSPIFFAGAESLNLVGASREPPAAARASSAAGAAACGVALRSIL